MSDASSLRDLLTVFDRLKKPLLPTPWWEGVDREVEAKKEGRFLAGTQEDEWRGVDDYSRLRADGQQWFFSASSASCMDARYRGIGIEEKATEVHLGKFFDGTVSRGLVWNLGDSQGIESGRGAVGIHLVTGGAPLSADQGGAFFRMIAALQLLDIHVLFFNSEGDHWPRTLGGREPVPAWLCESSPEDWALCPSATEEAIVAAESALAALGERVELKHPVKGTKPDWVELDVPGHEGRFAYAEWPNEWQALDVGMYLRAKGFQGVIVRCTKQKLKLGSKGVEKKLQAEMRKLGVVIEWGVEV